MAKMNLQEQANEILKIAEESGVSNNFFFVTTFKRYQVQLKMLSELERNMNEDGMLVTKEYVKGRKNLYSSPAVKDYNSTTDSANRTVATLMKIIKGFDKTAQESEEQDPLMMMINGGDNE